MARYRLGKTQIRRLLSGSYVNNIDGSKYYASESVKSSLKEIDDFDLYDRVEVFLDDSTRSISVADRVVTNVVEKETTKVDFIEDKIDERVDDIETICEESLFHKLKSFICGCFKK